MTSVSLAAIYTRISQLKPTVEANAD